MADPKKSKSLTHRRLRREYLPIEAMIHIYCHGQHDLNGEIDLCLECQSLRDYAHERLLRCPFQEDKSTCAKCSIHCYRPDMRERVREVMRYAGPHMAYRHPYLAFMHLVIDERRTPPPLLSSSPRKKGGNPG